MQKVKHHVAWSWSPFRASHNKCPSLDWIALALKFNSSLNAKPQWRVMHPPQKMGYTAAEIQTNSRLENRPSCMEHSFECYIQFNSDMKFTHMWSDQWSHQVGNMIACLQLWHQHPRAQTWKFFQGLQLVSNFTCWVKLLEKLINS